MLDFHTVWTQANWGILPYFKIGFLQIPTYSFFVFLGLIAGISIFWFLWKQDYKKNENSFYVIFAWILWGTLGAKIPIWIAYWNEIKASGNIESIISGRTITGGLIGWFLAILITKKILKIKTRYGNAIAPWASLWIAIGRIGCFLHGCCYGKPTSLPWWVDFWDGIFRHPTQIYEIIYLLILSVILLRYYKKDPKPWILFDFFLLFYFGFRFFIEFIRVEPKVIYGFSLYQLVSVIVVFYVLVKMNIKNKVK
jgi:phosphatidylglycerol---prolipoprotein diacylglyceryl transferase